MENINESNKENIKNNEIIIDKKTIKERNHEYYIQNREKLLLQAKQRVLNNPQKHNEYVKKYLDKNREKYREMKNMKFQCPICNGEYTYSNYNKHIITNKHVNTILKTTTHTEI